MATLATLQVQRLPKAWTKHVRAGVLNVISLAHFAIVHARGCAMNSSIPRVRLVAELEEARAEIALFQEELRIKDARLAKIDPRHRPHYPPTERLAILELRAARAWSAAETARRFYVEPATIALWMKRLDDGGETALVKTPEPVNRFPEFVRHIVKALRATSPFMGKKRIAQTLARCGLHLAATTVKRMLRERKGKRPSSATATSPPMASSDCIAAQAARKPVIARGLHLVWQMDLTVVPTRAGLWAPWIPFALPQRWPFCWWTAVVIDHFSRYVVGDAVFPKQPTSFEVRTFLARAIKTTEHSPKYLVTDLGTQFTCSDFPTWCAKRNIRNRYASKASIRATAIIERFFLSLKTELIARVTVSLRKDAFRRQLQDYLAWYHQHRPHQALGGRTPDEVYRGRVPANRKPRFEPRPRWPRASPCAAPYARPKKDPKRPLQLVVRYDDHERSLPIVDIKRAS